MNLTQHEIKGYCIVQINEERVDAHNSGELKERILDLIEQGNLNIIVQLDQVKFVDSSGLGALLAGYKQASAKAGKLALANMQQQVLSMFELTRLNRVFEIYNDVDEVFAAES
ncbi:STAS domain-containing protein [Methylicorpusculum oleiharenae]|uniref:STAS domain-containing protein n=1 Tax=Methylicorpusculum oleiharenae TaxID=1338687 RepID=UPI001356AC83|nr:STAS domain-containing protein [Methylicorpusculum oleiharenae]MBS3954830.1 STAS domain-containing protein [Methylomicrobium sp.]MCD2452518.1 STAS domain-containing protein [Methylicorpusculum oleiharenae]